MPMKIKETIQLPTVPETVRRDIERIQALWGDCRRRFGSGGPFLFGAFSVADAMYAPVVSRFRTYGVKLDDAAAEYSAEIWKLPAMQDWLAAAQAESFRMARYEK
jgi:glutathione S-transferase